MTTAFDVIVDIVVDEPLYSERLTNSTANTSSLSPAVTSCLLIPLRKSGLARSLSCLHRRVTPLSAPLPPPTRTSALQAQPPHPSHFILYSQRTHKSLPPDPHPASNPPLPPRPLPLTMSGWMSYITGKGKDTRQSARDSIVGLRSHLLALEKREDFLNKKVEEELKKAKNNATSNKRCE